MSSSLHSLQTLLSAIQNMEDLNRLKAVVAKDVKLYNKLLNSVKVEQTNVIDLTETYLNRVISNQVFSNQVISGAENMQLNQVHLRLQLNTSIPVLRSVMIYQLQCHFCKLMMMIMIWIKE